MFVVRGTPPTTEAQLLPNKEVTKEEEKEVVLSIFLIFISRSLLPFFISFTSLETVLNISFILEYSIY